MSHLLTWFAVALVFIITSGQEILQVALDDNCPSGPGVNGETVLIGTQATCRCVVLRLSNPQAQAQWYNRNDQPVGVKNAYDGSSTLTVSYNPLDTNQTFQCRSSTAATTLFPATYTPKFRCFYRLVEKSYPGLLYCPVPSRNVQSITWQLLNNGKWDVNISTCSLADNKCINYLPDRFTGFISASENESILNVRHPRYTETQFSYVTNHGERSSIAEIEVFAAPVVALCEQKYTQTYVDFTCTADNLYPGVVAKLSRQEKPLLTTDFYQNETKCVLGTYGSGKYGDYSATCNWRIKMESMLLVSHFTAELAARVSNASKTEHVATDSHTITLTLPEVEFLSYACPIAPRESVSKRTGGTCKCQLKTTWLSPGFARWYTQDNQIVGVENPSDKSSTLTLTYNSSDPNPTYYCKPITELPVTVTPKQYTPKFNSSPPSVVPPNLQLLIIIVGIILSWTTSSYE